MAQLKYEEGLTQDQYDQVSIPDTDKNSNNNDIQSNVMHLQDEFQLKDKKENDKLGKIKANQFKVSVKNGKIPLEENLDKDELENLKMNKNNDTVDWLENN